MKDFTDDPDKRLVYLSTIVAGTTALSLPLYVALSASSYVGFHMSAVDGNVLTTYLLAATLAFVYALGIDVYNAVTGDSEGESGERTDGAIRTE